MRLGGAISLRAAGAQAVVSQTKGETAEKDTFIVTLQAPSGRDLTCFVHCCIFSTWTSVWHIEGTQTSLTEGKKG